MNDFTIGLLVGLGAVLVIAVIFKWRARNKPMSIAEKAEYLSKRRARMLPALAIIFLSQQATFFSQMTGGEHVSAEGAKISAWLVLSVVMLFGLATKGFWLEPREVRDLARRREHASEPQRGDALGIPLRHGQRDRHIRFDDDRAS